MTIMATDVTFCLRRVISDKTVLTTTVHRLEEL